MQNRSCKKKLRNSEEQIKEELFESMVENNRLNQAAKNDLILKHDVT